MSDQLLKPREVAMLFGVGPRTVVRTPGGQLRFRQADIDALLQGDAGGLWQAGGR